MVSKINFKMAILDIPDEHLIVMYILLALVVVASVFLYLLSSFSYHDLKKKIVSRGESYSKNKTLTSIYVVHFCFRSYVTYQS